MKTFREFVFIVEDRMGERLGKMSDAEFEQFLKGRRPGETESFRTRRSTYRSKKTSGGQPPTGTTPPSSKPPNQSKIPKPVRQVGRGLIRGLGLASAADAAYQASQGNYADAAVSGLGAGMASRRVSAAVPRVQKQVLQKVAPRLAPKLTRFVPGIQQAYGLTAGTTALAKGDKLGAVLGYGSAIPGPVGYGFVAADIARSVTPSSVKQAIKDKTGISYLQQRKGLEQKAIQSGQGLTGVARAGQTMDARGARKVASKANVYGATKGSGIVGTGGPTTFNKAANTITTGGKTAQLPKTQILPGGRVGDLAYRGGKATYLARASVASRDTNVLSRLSRATGIGGQRERDAAASNRERQQAMQNTLRYRQQLGITGTGFSKPPTKPKK